MEDVWSILIREDDKEDIKSFLLLLLHAMFKYSLLRVLSGR